VIQTILNSIALNLLQGGSSMEIGAIGLAVSVSAGKGRFRRLEETLAHVHGLGYELVEIAISPLGIIFDGAVRPEPLADLVAVTRNFPLRYTVHGLNRLNLAYDARHDLCRRVMAAQIEVARAIGASRLVYHSGLQALDAVHYWVRRTLLSKQELADGAEREVAALRRLAPLARDAGLIIGMENGDSHLWEHNIMAQFGLLRADLAIHHARLMIAPIVRQLEAIDDPAVGMTLDIAHLHIAAHDLGFDYLEAVEIAAPWVRHLHANDNFGRLDWGFDNEPDRWPFGEADVHLPPGWGSIPYAEVFARLSRYQGDMILEIKGGFADYYGESLETMAALVEQSRSVQQS
jgi:sugar phosphate isomerase/epimerase